MTTTLLYVFAIPLGLAILSALISIILVGIGLLFKVDKGLRHFSDGTTIQNYELREWLKWLQNPVDNLTGDKHGRYWNEYMSGKPAWFKMWWWSGVRNPWNYLKLRIFGIDMREHKVVKVRGQDIVKDNFTYTGFHILKAIPDDVSKWNKYTLYWVMRWFKSDLAIVLQLGWKIKLSHNGMFEENENKYWKGFTFEINPIKRID